MCVSVSVKYHSFLPSHSVILITPISVGVRERESVCKCVNDCERVVPLFAVILLPPSGVGVGVCVGVGVYVRIFLWHSAMLTPPGVCVTE